MRRLIWAGADLYHVGSALGTSCRPRAHRPCKDRFTGYIVEIVNGVMQSPSVVKRYQLSPADERILEPARIERWIETDKVYGLTRSIFRH